MYYIVHHTTISTNQALDAKYVWHIVPLALRAAAASEHSLIGAMLFGLRVHPLFIRAW